MQKGTTTVTKEMQERRDKEGRQIVTDATTIPFEQFALICAAYVSPMGKVSKGYYTARQVNPQEVVLTIPDEVGNDVQWVVTLPKQVAVKMRPYDLDES